MDNLLQDKGKIARFIRSILDNPWKSIAASFVVIITLFVLMIRVSPIDVDFSYRTWFKPTDPLLAEFDSFERKYGNDDQIVLAVNSESGVFDVDTVNLLTGLTKDMWKVHDVIRVDSLINYNWVHGKVEPLLEPESGEVTQEFLDARLKIALKNEIVPDYLMSKDAKTAVLFARIKPAIVNYRKVIEEFIEDGKVLVSRSATEIEKERAAYIKERQEFHAEMGLGKEEAEKKAIADADVKSFADYKPVDGSFNKFMKKFKAESVDDDSLEAEGDDDVLSVEAEAGASEDVFAKVKKKRNDYLRALIKASLKKESELIQIPGYNSKQARGLLNYKQTMRILSSVDKLSYSDEIKLTKKEDVKRALGDLASEDRADLLTIIKLAEKEKSADYQKIIAETRNVVKKYQGKGDHKLFIAGGVYLLDSFRESTQRDLEIMIPVSLLMIIVFLVINFRSFKGIALYTLIGISVAAVILSIGRWVKPAAGGLVVLLVIFFISRLIFELIAKDFNNKKAGGVLQSLLVVIATITATFAVMGLMGFRFNNMTSVVPYVMIAIGVADSVHVLVTFYQFLNRGVTKYEAAYLSLRKNFIPTLLTSLSTSLGFVSFITSNVEPIANFGVLSAIATMIAWIVTYTVLGGFLVIFPASADKDLGTGEVDLKSLTARAISFSSMIKKNRKLILGMFALVATFAVIVSVNHRVNSDPFAYFKKSSDLRKSLEFMEEAVGAATGVELSISSGKADGIKDPKFLAKVAELQSFMEARQNKGEVYTSKTVSIIEILKATNRALNGGDQKFYKIPDTQEIVAEQLFFYAMNLPEGMNINDRMSIKADSMRLTALWKLHDSVTVLDEIQAVKDYAKKVGLEVSVTGKQVLFPSLNTYVVDSFIVSISIALVMVSILLCFAFKSIKLGLLSMIPNAIPLFFGSGMIWIMGQDLDMGMVIVFSVCLGIAVDDTIHFLENYRKSVSEGKEPEEALAEVFTFTVPALVTTTMVLVASFGTFILASFVPNINFGLYTAFTLGTALIADITFLPALLLSISGVGKKKEIV